MLRCEARGNPAPSVHCERPDSGAVLALGLLGPVTRALAGTYRCTAVNVQGQAVKEVTLTVECEWGCTRRISVSQGLGLTSLQGLKCVFGQDFGKGKRLVNGIRGRSWRRREGERWTCP